MAAPTERLEIMREGEVFFLARLDGLSDDELFAPSALPDWSRAHVVSHFSRNAAALINLLDWARTGVATPMYPSVEARSEGIEEGARQSAAALRAEAASGSARLLAAAAAMPAEAWDGEIRTALGRQTTGAEVPWMRIRENWVHAVDLEAGATVDEFPPQVVVDLLDEVTAFVTGRDGCPAVDPRCHRHRTALAHRARGRRRDAHGHANGSPRVAHRPSSRGAAPVVDGRRARRPAGFRPGLSA